MLHYRKVLFFLRCRGQICLSLFVFPENIVRGAAGIVANFILRAARVFISEFQVRKSVTMGTDRLKRPTPPPTNCLSSASPPCGRLPRSPTVFTAKLNHAIELGKPCAVRKRLTEIQQQNPLPFARRSLSPKVNTQACQISHRFIQRCHGESSPGVSLPPAFRETAIQSR